MNKMHMVTGLLMFGLFACGEAAPSDSVSSTDEAALRAPSDDRGDGEQSDEETGLSAECQREFESGEPSVECQRERQALAEGEGDPAAAEPTEETERERERCRQNPDACQQQEPSEDEPVDAERERCRQNPDACS